ncbi:MAG: hypothetical protein ACJAZ3_000637 [Sphingobacteriales bacterium]|jgi:hypothetical protein
MKPIQLLSKIPYLLLLLVFLTSCKEKEIKTIYLSNKALDYRIDTTISSFLMIDTNKISEEFSLVQDIFGNYQHQFISDLGHDVNLEIFKIEYLSAVNNLHIDYIFLASEEYTEFQINWNRKDLLTYNFDDKKVISGISPKVTFIDTMTVKGVTFNKIIEIDYSDKVNQIHSATPIITYIAAGKGLIKLVLTNGHVLERVN